MKRILIIADLKGWIMDRHARELKKRLTEYEIDIGYSRGTNVAKKALEYDCVYIMDPFGNISYPPKEKVIMGLRNEFMFRNHKDGARGLYEYGLPNYGTSLKDKCCILHMVNRMQMEVFKDIVIDKPLVLAQHGIDEEVFDRSKYTREERNDDTLLVGSSGRSNSPGQKGFNIVTKACSNVGAKHIGTRYQGGQRLTKEQMPLFYNSLDVYACMSETEGLNNPIMEAGAMGIPVISTYAGAAPEIIEPFGTNSFLIERNVKQLTQALDVLKKDRILRKEMGDLIYEEIMKNWTWKVRIQDFKNMFELFFRGQ